MSNFVENDSFILFRYNVGYSNRNFVLFEKDTDEVKISDIIDNDLIFKQDNEGYWGNFRFSDTKGAYQSHNIEMVAKLIESMKNNQAENGLDKFHQLEQLVQSKEESNPVIFFYEFK